MNNTASAQSRTEPPLFPRAVLITSRQEHQLLPLEIYTRNDASGNPPATNSPDFILDEYWQSGQLPGDLRGHFFAVGAVGSFDSKPPQEIGTGGPSASGVANGSQTGDRIVAPAQGGFSSIVNGDGMVYRLDFQAKPDLDSNDPTAMQEDPGKAWLSSKLVKTPDFFLDEAISQNVAPSEDKKFNFLLSFFNVGLARISPILGGRNCLNTALVPLACADGSSRLAVTWDAGRPYEVDPRTLDLAGPIGWQKDWRFIVGFPEVLDELVDEFEADLSESQASPDRELDASDLGGPFFTALTTAHPQFDANTNEFFSVNGVKSLRDLLLLNRMIRSNLVRWFRRLRRKVKMPAIIQLLLQGLVAVISWILKQVGNFIEWLGFWGENELYLVRWRVSQDNSQQKTDADSWPLLDEGGNPIAVSQSLHQMGLTKDYVLISDSAFKLPLDSFLPADNILPAIEKLKAKIYPFLTYPQLWYLPLYLVPRQQLKTVPPGQPITVKRIQLRGLKLLNPKTFLKPGAAINPEAGHFLTDYDNPDGRITIHAAHGIATDPAEFIHDTDTYFEDGPQPLGFLGKVLAFVGRKPQKRDPDPAAQRMTESLRERSGMVVAPMDANLLGSWTIDAERGEVLASAFSDETGSEKNGVSQRVWFPAIYAWRGNSQCGTYSPSQFTDVYWLDYGIWPQLASRLIYQLYYRHKNRVLDRQELREVLASGKPAALVRSQIQREDGSASAVEIVDRYEFPRNFLCNTPQFIPRAGGTESTDGYLLCTVLWGNTVADKNVEFWIFDAAKLSAGPQYRLRSPKLNFGLTIHSTWMQSLGIAPPREDYSIKQDYEELVDGLKARLPAHLFACVEDLFERFVYPR